MAKPIPWSHCYDKVLYLDKDTALKELSWLANKGARLRIYPCNLGAGAAHFHIGHRSHRQRVKTP